MSRVLNLRWNGTDFKVEVAESATVLDVKVKMEELTGVEVARQKYLGLKLKKGLATDSTMVLDLTIKPEQRIMMLGTPNAVIEEATRQAEIAPEVDDDFELDSHQGLNLGLAQRPESTPFSTPHLLRWNLVQEKLQRRLETVKVKIMNPPRPGKKLLVVDIDQTIFDLGSSAERVEELARPYLHYFFKSCYEFFDLMIWSATSMRWVEIKMKELGVSTHEDYRLVCMLDQSAMVMVQTERYGVFNCKPLEFIWRTFPDHYNPSNTVMLDDLKQNFVMNRQNGLQIRPYRKAHLHRETDQELRLLADYFSLIGQLESLSHLKHRKWEKHLQKRTSNQQSHIEED